MNKHFCFLITLLPLACIVQDGETAAAKLSTEVLVLQNGTPLSLSCNGTTDVGQIQWMKDCVTVTNSESIKIRGDKLDLAISQTKTVQPLLGNYTCKYVNSNEILSSYQIISDPPVEFASKDPPSVKVNGRLELTCVTSKVYGPHITWIFCDKAYQHTEGHVRISKYENTKRGVEGAVLVVENLKMDQFCNITCKVRFSKINHGYETEVTTYVSVWDGSGHVWLYVIITFSLMAVFCCIMFRIPRKMLNITKLRDANIE